jgi:hypothetical protein
MQEKQVQRQVKWRDLKGLVEVVHLPSSPTQGKAIESLGQLSVMNLTFQTTVK